MARNFGRSSRNGNLYRKRGIPQCPQRTSFGRKSSLWNQWKSAFLQRASEEAPPRRQPEFPRREHAHDVETQVGGAMRHFRSRFQWVWNWRLELGQHLSATQMRTTEFAPALEASSAPVSEPTPAVVYGSPQWARRSFTGGFPGSAFALQPDGSLLCPANHPLYAQERRPEGDGSYRLLYAARIGDCRICELRAHCQESPSTLKPRRVSAVFWPVTATQASPLVQSLPEPSPTMPAPVPRLGGLAALSPAAQIDAGGAHRVSHPDQR